MKKIIFILMFFSFTAKGYSQQDTSLPLVKVIKGKYADFAVDNLGNILLLDSNNQLKKIDPNFDSVAIFNDVRKYGKVFSIDAGNPLKILLYYRDFGTIVVLDRLLNVRTTIDLRKQNIFQAKAICQSYDNAVWVYDEGEAKLKRIGDDGNIIDQTGDFRLQLDEAPSPAFIEDHDRLVYLYDSSKGLLVFDYFGTLKNKLAFLGWQDFQLAGKYIVGRKGVLLERYQLASLSLEEKLLLGILKNVDKIRISGDRLFCLRGGYLYVYSL
ncbi:MAG: hypothetical protein ABIR15_00150 [Chitinophagaceae bacterium]